MDGFTKIWSQTLGWLKKGIPTPLSGSKRRRDDSDDNVDQRVPQSARADQPRNSETDRLNVLQTTAAPAAGPPVEPLLGPAPIHDRVPAEPSYASYGFDMAARVREFSPLRARKQAASNGGADKMQAVSAQHDLQHPPGRQLDSAQQAQHDSAAPHAQPLVAQAPASVAAAAPGQRRPSQNSARYQQPQMPAQPPVGRMIAPDSTVRGPYGQGNYHAGPPAQSSFRPATPRQLFATPDSTRRQLDNLRLGGGTPLGPAGMAAAAPLQARMGAQAAAGRDSYSTRLGGTPAAAGGAAAATRSGPFSVGVPLSVMTAAARLGPERMAPSYPGQQQQQLLYPSGLPFHVLMALGFRELGPQGASTSEQLREMVRMYEANQRPRPAATPLREDGGYVAGDDEEAITKTASKANEARALVDKLRQGVAAAHRAASGDPRVASAAANSLATRSSLATSVAAAGADAVEAISLKLAAHEQARERVKADAAELTRRQLEALKAEEEAQRADLERLQQRRRQELGLPPSFVSGPGPAAAAAAGPAPPRAPAAATAASVGKAAAAVAGRGRAAPPPKAKPPPAAADDDVLDLVSSDEEVEEEEAEGDEVEAGDEGEEDDSDPYGVEYGAYPGEERGGGNPALRYASRAERATWRRAMDPGADERELMVDFRPNNVCIVELPRSKLQCMDVGVWLNDEVINLYMLLLQVRDTRLRQSGAGGPRTPRCHFFNSFFYNKLFQDEGKYNYANVRRWTTPKQLSNKLQASPSVLELDRIIMPIHKGVHWTCAEVDLKAQAVRYYDSLKGEDHALPKHLLSWVADEAADKLKQRLDTSKWSVEFPKNIPKQLNGCDCGVFSIMFADRLGAGLPLNFSQADMPLLRVKVLHRIVQMHVDAD